MYMLYQQLKVIEGMELSKAIWYSDTFGSYYEFFFSFFFSFILNLFWLVCLNVYRKILPAEVPTWRVKWVYWTLSWLGHVSKFNHASPLCWVMLDPSWIHNWRRKHNNWSHLSCYLLMRIVSISHWQTIVVYTHRKHRKFIVSFYTYFPIAPNT